MNGRQQQILSSVLKQVGQDGWTELAFERGVKEAGASMTEARKAFPTGIEAIVMAFHDSIDETMEMRLKSKRNFTAMRTRDKIAFAVRARLEAAAPHRNALRRLMVWAVMPRHLSNSARRLWQAADKMWMAAGDASTDYNYYTKRALLIAVMKATMVFWLNDESLDQSETWEFLDRRIDDVMKAGKAMSVAKTVGVSDILSLVRSRFAA
jgi:ubiquinone biosynthesis protein COQ9